VLAAFLNSAAADRAFRCISGTVAVSAYELESMPLPSPSSMDKIAELLGGRRGAEKLEQAFYQLYEPG
jgi:adenine-specific DNA-methyltransferase